jgi:hypothetical protein
MSIEAQLHGFLQKFSFPDAQILHNPQNRLRRVLLPNKFRPRLLPTRLAATFFEFFTTSARTGGIPTDLLR